MVSEQHPFHPARSHQDMSTMTPAVLHIGQQRTRGNRGCWRHLVGFATAQKLQDYVSTNSWSKGSKSTSNEYTSYQIFIIHWKIIFIFQISHIRYSYIHVCSLFVNSPFLPSNCDEFWWPTGLKQTRDRSKGSVQSKGVAGSHRIVRAVRAFSKKQKYKATRQVQTQVDS